MSKPIYEPSEWGKRVHNLKVNFVFGGGAAGPGKSTCMRFDPLTQIAVEHQRCFNPDAKHPLKDELIAEHGVEKAETLWRLSPGESQAWCLYLRRTTKELKQAITKSLVEFRRIDPGAHWSSGDSTWTFSSGLKYQFGHCHTKEDWAPYLGQEYTWIGFDELVTFEEEQFDQIITRLRTTDPVLQKLKRVVAMSNPMMKRESGDNYMVKDPTWVRRRFVDPEPSGNVIFKNKFKMSDGTYETWAWVFLPAKLSDNPDPAFRRDYELQLRNAPMHIRRAQLYGDWYVTVGSYYGAVWNPQLHVVRPYRIPSYWPVFRSMDWGFKNPGCIHWHALDEDDNLVTFYEYTFKGRTDRQVAIAVRRIETEILKIPWRDGESQLTGPADTQLWEQRGNSVASMAEVMAQMGVRWVKASKDSRVRNAQELYRRLDDNKSGTVTPGLTVFRNCKDLIKSLPAVLGEDGDPEMPAKGKESHWHESMMYACAFASRGRRGIPSRVSDDDYARLRKAQAQRQPYSGGLYGARI